MAAPTSLWGRSTFAGMSNALHVVLMTSASLGVMLTGYPWARDNGVYPVRLAFSLFVAMFLVSASQAMALTWEEIVTTQFVREHPDLVSVVTEEEAGLVTFTVVMKFKQPRYIVTQMQVRDAQRTLSVSRTPIYTYIEKNTFHFSIPRELIGWSTYSVSVGFPLERAGHEPVPLPGSTRYLFRLSDLVSPKVSESADLAREFAEAAGESLKIQE